MSIFELQAHETLGPIAFGIHRSEVSKILGSKPKLFKKAVLSQNETEAYDSHDLHIYYSNSDLVDFIEVFPSNTHSFIFNGINLFSTSAKEIINTLELLEVEEGSSYLLKNKDISFWRSSSEETYFQSVGLGVKGYYDSDV